MQKTALIEVDKRQLIEDGILKWGNAVSERVLDPEYQYFQIPGVDGFIGYRLEGNYAIVFGAPIAPPENIEVLADGFHLFCREKNWNYIYTLVDEPFARWALSHDCHMLIEVGEEVILDLHIDPMKTKGNLKLRNKVNHAAHEGLKVQEYIPFDSPIENEIIQVGEEWLKDRQGPQIHFEELDLFKIRANKRWFYVKDDKSIQAVALLSRLEGKSGYLIKHLVTRPKAPRGTSALLVVSIMEILRNEGFDNLTYGIVPITHTGEMEGLGFFSHFLVKMGFKMTRWIFNLSHRKEYWQQFKPKAERIFLVLSKQMFSLQDIRIILQSFKIELHP